MDGHGDLPVTVRFYADEDRDSLEKFKCAWRRWEKDAQRIIRDAPSIRLNNQIVEILVAQHGDGELVGVAVFSIFPDKSCDIYSLGVLTKHKHRHVGTRLKKAVMVEAESRYPGCRIVSTVHRRNTWMNQINENLQAVVEPFSEDHEYLLTLVEARLTF
jgi:RimJ/RimL family protein N-acetyltransferase